MKITADTAQPGDCVLALEGEDVGGVFVYRDAPPDGTPKWLTAGSSLSVDPPQGVLALLVRDGSQVCCHTDDPQEKADG